MARLGRMLAPPGMVGTALLVLLATVTLAANFSAFAFIGGLPKLQDLDYSADHFGRIAPLRADFIAASLGVGNLERLRASVPEIQGGSRGGPATRATLGTTIPPLPILPTPPELRVSMSASPRSVSGGDIIEYAMTVTNVGESDFEGEFLLESHIPLGTTFAPRCDVPEIDEKGNVCYPDRTPGTTEGQNMDDPHVLTPITVSETQRKIPAGKRYVYEFRVIVNEGLPSGFEIINHAHLTVLDKKQDTPVVVVRVR